MTKKLKNVRNPHMVAQGGKRCLNLPQGRNEELGTLGIARKQMSIDPEGFS